MAHEVTYVRAAAGLVPVGGENGGRTDDLATARSARKGRQKALAKMNIQLATNVISDITGVSGQAVITEILKGERDPWELADLKHEMVKASREEVARSLEGNWRPAV